MNPADLAELLKATATAVLTEHALDTAALPPVITVERPRNPEHGDYASNLALQLAKKVGANPRELAGWLAEALAEADGIASAEVAGPGFINLRLDASAQGLIVNNVIDAGHTYGNSDAEAGHKINLEFVSANPTGPIHIGGTRWAAVGDALGRLLTTQGADVVREYYFNDHGAQIDRFANSLIAAAKGEPTPEDGYAGNYIADIAAQILAAGARRAEPARRRAARDVPADRRRLDVHPHQEVAARVRHRLRRLHPRRLDAHQRPRRRRPSRSCVRTATSTRRTAQPGCAPVLLATTKTAS